MKYRDKEWFNEQYTIKKRTLTDIADELGSSAGVIHSWRVKHGIEKLHRPSDNNTYVKVQCKQCKEDFETKLRYVWRRIRDEDRTYFYCSNACQTDSMKGRRFPDKGLKGVDNPAWKGGVSGINEVLRDSVRLWKRDVMRAQNYTCFVTGERVRDFHIHHITPFHEIRDKAIQELGLTILPTLAENDSVEIKRLQDRIIELHECVQGYVITADLHMTFHGLYGNKTTETDLDEFKTRHRFGEFDELEAIA